MNWALHERERIVGERDSLRQACDALRDERDGAISKYAQALATSPGAMVDMKYVSIALKHYSAIGSTCP